MSNGLPCPNPACNHVFPAGSLSGTGTLTCPRCGKAFSFRPRAAGAPRSAPQPAAASSSAPSPPLAQPVEPSPADLFVPPPDDAPIRRRRRRWQGWVRAAVLVLAVASVCALIAGGIVLSARVREGKAVEILGHKIVDGRGGSGEGPAAIDLGEVATFTPPGPAWKTDTRTADDLNAGLGMKREHPPAFLAIYLKSYKDHNPRDAQLVEEALRLLKRKFQTNVEYQLDAPEHLGSLPMQRLSFQGEVNNQLYSGECYVLAYKGIGVWLFTWTPGTIDERDPSLREELAGVYKGLAMKERPGWKGDHRARHVFPGVKAPYTLEDTDDLWTRKRAEDFDVDADLALQAFDRESRLADKTAEVLVFVLQAPENGSVLEAAQAWLDRYHKKGYEKTVSEPLLTKAGAKDWSDHVGTAKGHVLKYRVRNTETRERLVVVGIVPHGAQYLLIHGECDWRYRGLWETDFVQLLDTFRLK